MDTKQGLFGQTVGRRSFWGAAGTVAAGAAGLAGCSWGVRDQRSIQTGARPIVKPAQSTVYLRTGNSRYDMLRDALAPLRQKVAEDTAGKQIILKVNSPLVDPEYIDYSSHVDQLRAILDFLKPIYTEQIIVAEGTTGTSSVFPSYENYGYLPLADEYNIELVDANDMPHRTVFIHQFQQYPFAIEANAAYLDPEVYLISAAVLKTHNAVTATFSLKNIAMGSPLNRYREEENPARNDKSRMHGGQGAPDRGSGQDLSYNLFTLALAGARPDLAVVDGFHGIEGNGPWNGDKVDHRVCVVSTDFVAADRICTELIGLDPFYLKYMEFCGNAGMGNWDVERIRVDGPDYRDHVRTYRLNDNVEGQIAWIDRLFER